MTTNSTPPEGGGSEVEGLRALLTSRGELVGSMTHDLKGLITGLEGGFYMVESGLKKNRPERIGQGVEMARRNLDRMRRAISSALYYVKERELVRQPVELAPTLEAVRAELADYAASLGVDLELADTAGTVETDDLALHALLIDVVDYALAAAQEGTEPRVVLTAGGGDAAVTITARGFLISEEVVAQLRAGLYAPRQRDRAHLGLFIASTLVTALGGELAVETEAPATTHFGVRLVAGG